MLNAHRRASNHLRAERLGRHTEFLPQDGVTIGLGPGAELERRLHGRVGAEQFQVQHVAGPMVDQGQEEFAAADDGAAVDDLDDVAGTDAGRSRRRHGSTSATAQGSCGNSRVRSPVEMQ